MPLGLAQEGALLEPARLFKYIFLDEKSEFVEQLPWIHPASMWLTPKPVLSSTEEIRERLKLSHFRIYMGNLPRKVDSFLLQEFCEKHGKVTDARVMLDRKTRRSRGFGFVTIAAAGDDELAHAIAKLRGQTMNPQIGLDEAALRSSGVRRGTTRTAPQGSWGSMAELDVVSGELVDAD
ncbi:hypothetical protein EJB05_28917, partial [Eragrostis curvula]